jgi:hypothetical protein
MARVGVRGASAVLVAVVLPALYTHGQARAQRSARVGQSVTRVQRAAAVLGAAVMPHSGAWTAFLACHNMILSPSDRSALREAWRRSRHLARDLRLEAKKHGRGAPYAGVCGSSKWAFADFFAAGGQRLTEHDEIALQDGPDVFRRRAGEGWRDITDTGGDIPCGGPVGLPRQLVRIWGLRCP